MVGGGGTTLHSHIASAFTSHCNIYRSTAQSISSGSATKVELATKDYDNDNEFDSVTNYRFQPIVAGYYHVDMAVRIESVENSKKYFAALYKTGEEVRRSEYTTGVAGSVAAIISCDMYLLTTDYIELWVYHNHGSSRNISGSRSTFMNVHRFA